MKNQPGLQTTCHELVKLFLQGTSDAFGVLCGKYYGFIRNTCFKIIKNEETTSDLVQETFSHALAKLHYFKVKSGEKSFKKWIWRIALNVSIDYLRSLQRDKEAVKKAFAKENIGISKEPSPDKSAQDEERKELLMAAISELPDITRKCFISHYVIGLSYAEICEDFALTKNQLTHQLDIGRRILAKKLKKII